MAKIMNIIAAIVLSAAICFSLLYSFTEIEFFLTIAITFGTTAYHFCIRLIVGALFNVKMKNRVDFTKKWYQVSLAEQKFYQKINVKKWKNKMPTYDIDVFDISKHSLNEILQSTCQSELVHEANIILSFLPIVASAWFGAFFNIFDYILAKRRF